MVSDVTSVHNNDNGNENKNNNRLGLPAMVLRCCLESTCVPLSAAARAAIGLLVLALNSSTRFGTVNAGSASRAGVRISQGQACGSEEPLAHPKLLSANASMVDVSGSN